ncbi:MAG: YciI family protein [Thermoanaerobaculia bacterium]
MKFLCLAYGAEKDWKETPGELQQELLAQDEKLRKRGTFMSAVQTGVTTVTAWDGATKTTNGTFAKANIPLAGFSILEAKDLAEAVELVAKTPCARAKGAIEIRAFWESAPQ